MFKTIRASSFGLWLSILGSAGLTAAGPGAPGLIYLKAGPRVAPVWVSAQEAAASEPGDLRWPLFVEADQSKLRRFMAESERLRAEQRNRGAGESDLDCPIVLSAGDEDRIDPKPNRSFSDLTEQALAIYSGRVEEISPGFFSGLPSSLLLVSVKEELRASDLVARDGLLIPYSFARFKAGGATFCGGGAGMYQPKRGDQVLVFIYDPPLDAAGTLVYPRSPEIFFQSSDGRLIIPEPLKADRDVAAAGSLESLEDLLRWKLSNEPQRPSNPRADHAQ